jgi:UDP-2-acetamido-3-amino-2,3-dideoxy-glucuronate N-acetyltransferase
MIHLSANFYSTGYAPESTSVGAFTDIGSPLGENSKVQSHVSIPPGWTLGNNVFYGPGCRFANDDKPSLNKEFVVTFGTVEDDVVIGMNASIGAGLKIGEGAIIGMGAVVTRDVPPYETWVGNPARNINEI